MIFPFRKRHFPLANPQLSLILTSSSVQLGRLVCRLLIFGCLDTRTCPCGLTAPGTERATATLRVVCATGAISDQGRVFLNWSLGAALGDRLL